jgi:hypothetical protein
MGGTLVEEEHAISAVHRTDLSGVPEPVRAAYTAPPTAWTSETAAEAGRKSGEARRRKRLLSPEDRAFDAIGQKLGDLTKELIDAALGTGDFEDLKLETRVTALQRLMEWRLGRPAAVKPKEEPDSPAVPASGNDLFE